MIAYAYKVNVILVEPLKNRTGNILLQAYQRIYDQLEAAAGFKPVLHVLDNEASADFKLFPKTQQVDFQLVPPQTHQHNAAKRAIQTFKNHFVAELCSTQKQFPMHLWDRLPPKQPSPLTSFAKSGGTPPYQLINSCMQILISTVST